MQFRWKLLAVALVLAAALNLALYLFSSRTLSSEMAHLERRQVMQILGLGESLLARRLESLNKTTIDFAFWDDSYAFMQTHDPAYISSNLTDSTYTNLNLRLIVYVSATGDIVYGGYYDSRHEAIRDLPPSLSQELLSHPEVWRRPTPESGWKGLMRLGGELYLASSQPILTSDDEGPARGSLLLAIPLDARILAELRQDSGYEYSFVSSISDPVQNPPLVLFGDSGQRLSMRVADPNYIYGWTGLEMLGSPQEIKLQVRLPRHTYRHGENIQRSLLSGTLLISLLFTLLVYLSVDKALVARKKMQRGADQLEELSRELAAILDGIAHPLLLIDKQRMVRWSNKAGVSLVPSTENVFQGKYVSGLPYVSLFPDAPSGAAVSRCFASGEVTESQYHNARGQDVVERAFPLLGADGELEGVILQQQDITEQLSLLRQTEQLDRLTSLGEVAAGVAHEINNPLGMLQMNLNLFTDVAGDLKPILDETLGVKNPLLGGLPYGLLRERAPLLLDEMREACQRVRRLVEDLKGFARHEEVGGFAPFEVSAAVDAAARLVQYALRKGGNELEVDLRLPLPRIHGAQYRIEQVLVNLLLNAQHACLDNTEPIRLVAAFEEGTQMLVVQVVDSGCGMAEEVMRRATDPFFTTRRDQGGTGLGLSLSNRIIGDHGGTMQIESVEGRGTTISLRLPAEKGAQDDRSLPG